MSLLKTKSLILEKRIAIVVIGGATSIIGTSYFEGWLNYVSYAVILAIGYWSLTQKNALINGTLFGTALYLTDFLMTNDKSYFMYIISFAIFFMTMGALIGIAIAYIGYSVKVLTQKRK